MEEGQLRAPRVKNPDYWGGAPTIDEVFFQTYTNADTMTQDLKAGTHRRRLRHPAGAVRAVVQDRRASTAIALQPVHCEYLSASTATTVPTHWATPCSSDVKFRQALQLGGRQARSCVDIGLERLRAPAARPCCRPTSGRPTSTPTTSPPPKSCYGFDIAKANQMLEEAGYNDSDGNGIREYKGKDIKLRL